MPTVDDYIATLPPAKQAELERIRDIVVRVVPSVEQGTSYAMPAYLYKGKALLIVMVAKHHLGLYPFSGKVIDALRDRLQDFELSSGTVRFSEDHPLPEPTLTAIIQERVQEIERALR